MKSVMEELQESENEHYEGYTLKTNEELIEIICDFGNGVTEFHTVDIERLIIENQRITKTLLDIIECQTKSLIETPK